MENLPEWEDVADMAVVHMMAATAAIFIMGLLGSIFQ